MGDVSDGSWGENRLAGDLSGRFLTLTKKGTLEGEILGTYSDQPKHWQAVSLGTWQAGGALSFSSYLDRDYLLGLTHQLQGNYEYDDGSYYGYGYDEYMGFSNFYNETDGTFTLWDYGPRGSNDDFYCSVWVYDSSNDLISYSSTALGASFDYASLADNPYPQLTVRNHSEWSWYYGATTGDVEAIMGGTGNLWTSSEAAPAGITFLGQYDRWGGIAQHQLLLTEIESYNPYDGTFTTPDGGAYAGYAGGFFATGPDDNDVEGRIYGLYLSPGTSEAGLLKGTFSGRTYDEIEMWEADGVLYRTTTLAPDDLGVITADALIEQGYLAKGYGWGHGMRGDFGGDGSIQTNIGFYSMPDWAPLDATLSVMGQSWGVFHFFLGGQAGYDNPAGSDTWSARVGGFGQFGSYQNSLGEWRLIDGYWLADVTDGSWSGERLEGGLSGKFQSYGLIGTLAGEILGTYSDDPKNWQAVSLGEWSGEWTRSGSGLNPDVRRAVHRYDASYAYSNGDSYSSYYYEDQSYGWSYYWRADGSYVQTTYNDDGTSWTYDSLTGGSTSGTWDPATQDLASLVATPPEPGEGVEYWLTWTDDGYEGYSSGYMDGIMGSTASLWSGSDVPVSVLGQYSNYPTDNNGIWFDQQIDIHNDHLGEYTDWDDPRGSYYGLAGGTKIDDQLEGQFLAIYIDPAGNAGYLRADLDGIGYAGIGMFEMNGLLNREQVKTAAQLGMTPAELHDSVWWGSLWGSGIKGGFNGGGPLTGELGWPNSALTINAYAVNPSPDNIIPDWGIYGMTVYGGADNPTSEWSGTLGGQGSFAPHNFYQRYSGDYDYSNGDSYNYNYSKMTLTGEDREGWSYYYRTDGTYYDVYYYKEGTTSTYDSATDTWTSGTWDPATTDLALLATPPAPPEGETYELTSSDTYHDGDDGYWAAEVTNGQLVDGKLTAAVDGRFLSRTQLGQLTGHLQGSYNQPQNTWEAVVLGTWEGEPLTFMSDIGGRVLSMDIVYSGQYDDPDGASYYRYDYNQDKTYGYSYGYLESDSSYVSTRYYADGRVERYDSSAERWTYGSWDPASDDLRALLVAGAPAGYDPPTQENSNRQFYWTSDFQGLLGVTGSPWDAGAENPAPLTTMGRFDTYSFNPGDISRSIWYGKELYSHNVRDNTRTTVDGGAYEGFVAGTRLDNALEGRLLALYTDPSGNAGILTGDLVGEVYGTSDSFYSDTFSTEGGAFPVRMVSGLGIAPEDFETSINHNYNYISPTLSQSGGSFLAGESSIGTITVEGYEKDSAWIDGEWWGIELAIIHGGFDGTSADTWEGAISYDQGAESIFTNYIGSEWSGGQIAATGAGAWVNWDQAVTGVAGGELLGTFDPAKSTFQSVASWAWMDTNTFLNMVDTNRAALDALNIPAFEIGRATLAGADSTLNVQMNDVRFFAASTGGDPRIWATNGVSGGYASNPLGHTVLLNGGGLSADFQVRGWDAGKWGAQINNGAGTLNRTDVGGSIGINFKGAAAGSYSGGTFSGTGSGVANPQ